MSRLIGMCVVTLLAGAIFCGGCFRANVDLNGNGESSRSDKQRSPLPAEGNGNGNGWASRIGEIVGETILGAEKGLMFYAYDTLAYPGEEVELVARLQSETLQAIRGAKLGFFHQDEQVASADTDAEGFARAKWRPPEEGNFKLQVRVLEAPRDDRQEQLLQSSPQPLLVSARPKDSRFIVVDLDHTVVASGFIDVLLGRAEPMADSVEVMNRIAQQYNVIYLTHRPDLLTRRSKNWLEKYEYPTGPLLVADVSQMGDSGRFKSSRLESLRRSYANIEIGIGDKISDVSAYVNNGMEGYLIPNYTRGDPESMRKTAAEIRTLQGQGTVHVVDNWRQIESGIFQGQSFPLQTYVQELEARAQTLQGASGDDDDD